VAACASASTRAALKAADAALGDNVELVIAPAKPTPS
jgi:hypothetical protein